MRWILRHLCLPIDRARIMHQPPCFAHEEGMRVRDGKIVHHRRPHDQAYGLDDAVAAIHAADAVARGQLTRGNPRARGGVEGMLRRGVNGFVVDGQRDDRRVEVRRAARSAAFTLCSAHPKESPLVDKTGVGRHARLRSLFQVMI